MSPAGKAAKKIRGKGTGTGPALKGAPERAPETPAWDVTAEYEAALEKRSAEK